MRALRLGAFDHLVAPFDIGEGAMQIELLVERRRAAHHAELVAGDLTVSPAVRTVTRNGQVVALTPRELDLLLVLIRSRGIAVPKQDLLETVWNGDNRTLNVVEANVSSLRRKLHGLGPPVIHTVHRSGYVFREVRCAPPDATRERLALDHESIVRSTRNGARDELLLNRRRTSSGLAPPTRRPWRPP